MPKENNQQHNTPNVVQASDDSIGDSGNSIRKILQTAITIALFAFAMWFLHKEFSSITITDVVKSFHDIPNTYLALAFLLTVLNYVVLIGYDFLAVRLIKHPLTFKQVVTASFLYYAFSNSLGTVFGGTPVRVRLYSGWGMSTGEIVRLILQISIAFWVGLFLLAGVLFIATPFSIPDRFHLPMDSSRSMGYFLLIVPAAYFVFCAVRRRPLHALGVNLQPPPLGLGSAMIVVAVVDFLAASAALYVLLPADLSVGFLSFTAVYLLAIFVSLVSNVPGGLGVLELVLVTMLGKSDHDFLAALLAYRIIYYLIPLAVALIAVAIESVRHRADKAKKIATVAAHWSGIISPRIVTGSIFVAGLILLISGALPSEEGRMALLRRGLPLPIVEVSHFVGSIAGAFLLVLARALQRRIDAAWVLTVGMLAVGIVVSVTKGFDYEEAVILSVLLLAMLPCRRHFYRRGSILAPKFTWGWISALLIATGLSVWLVLFSYKHVEYTNDLWWSFTYEGDAPRALRAALGMIVVITLVAIGHLMRPVHHIPQYADDAELERVANIVARCELSNANLALLGDKRFIYSDDGKAAVMFDRAGKSWVSMGDPIGDEESIDDAAWKFMEECDSAGVWPVFYQVSEQSLGRYVEMGLTMLKLGELARVPLKDFSLEGASRKDLRRTKKKSEEAGLSVEVITHSDVASIMPRLKEISDAWLAHKSAGEKGFSLGFFDEAYLVRYDIAVVRNAEHHILAFANIWAGANKHELSIDLMRYTPEAPHGVMEYLFTELMLYGHTADYEWFDLGMAPLSGLTSHRLGPLWNQFSGVLFRHGEQFYNFQGLRNYKNKFDPVWTSKYLACPGGFATPQILTNVSTLISGGVTKLLRR